MPEPDVLSANSDSTKLPPPSGDSQRAEKYINELVPLISQGKLIVEHTDLSKYDPSSLHDHYRIDMQDYQVEISHSKQALTGKDSYVLLFNNLKNIEQGCTQKAILAYLILTADQFKKLQDVADEQIETRKKIEEAKRFEQAINPVDVMLEKIAKGEIDVSKVAQPVPEIIPEDQIKSQSKADQPLDEEKSVEPVESIDQKSEAEASQSTMAPPGSDSSAESAVQNGVPAQPLSAPVAVRSTEQTVVPAETPTGDIPQPLTTSLEPPVQAQPGLPTDNPTSFQPNTSALSQIAAATQTQAPKLADTGSPLAQADQGGPTLVSGTPTAEASKSVKLEEIQRALHQAAQTYQPPQIVPTNGIPTLGSLPASQQGDQSATTAVTPPPSAGIDQAIDQAFRPADNSLLTSPTANPNTQT